MRPHPFAQAGDLRAAYDAVDWAGTPLGAVADWSPALRSAVDLTLSTRFPVTLLWGPELVLVHNQGYTELIDAKHPDALGRRCEDVFPEVWDVIGPMLHSVLETGVPTWVEDTYLPLQRSTFLEECCFTLLGVEPATSRRDLHGSLAPGASLLLYTDGLVERRDASFDEGVAWLRDTVAGRQDLTAGELCDHIIDQFGTRFADDIALLVVRAPA